MINDLLASLTDAWNWTAAGCIWLVDHWSGVAALVIFLSQLYINFRKIKHMNKEQDEK